MTNPPRRSIKSRMFRIFARPSVRPSSVFVARRRAFRERRSLSLTFQAFFTPPVSRGLVGATPRSLTHSLAALSLSLWGS